MERRGMSLAQIQEIPKESLILLSGPPGAGKSTFCHQVVANSIVAERPIIFVTSEQSPAEVLKLLTQTGMDQPMGLNFVDAFTETVGLTTTEQTATVYANCADLNSLSIAISKIQESAGLRGALLVFDSLTTPYLFSGQEVVKFMRLFLSRFTSEGNAVLALVDEGCGKEEDMVAMMSIADGILKMEIKEDSRIVNVVKHPGLTPTRIEVPIEAKPTIKSAFDAFKSTVLSDPGRMNEWVRSMSGQPGAAIRREMGDYVNLFWPNFAHWSTMLWDPKGFPMMIYELNKEDAAFAVSKEMLTFTTRRMALLIKLIFAMQALGLFPKNYSKVADMRKFSRMGGGGPWGKIAPLERSGTIQYLEDMSKTDEHYFRVYESSDCWGFDNVGAAMASHLPPHMAGQLTGFEKNGQEWNAIETKCIGLGDPYCEFKLVPGNG